MAFGIDGVAGAIKTRIAAMDGETCPESPTTHAARVSREMEFAALRHRFRTGEGVRLATPKFGRLKSFVFEQVAQINKQSSLRLQCEEKYDRYFRVVGPHASMVAGWRRYYANTLEDSELILRLWTGRGRWPDMPDGGGFGLHEPQVLGERILDFNLLRTDVIGWIENNNHEFGAESLSESLLHWLIEANGKRSQQK